MRLERARKPAGFDYKPLHRRRNGCIERSEERRHAAPLFHGHPEIAAAYDRPRRFRRPPGLTPFQERRRRPLYGGVWNAVHPWRPDHLPPPEGNCESGKRPPWSEALLQEVS